MKAGDVITLTKTTIAQTAHKSNIDAVILKSGTMIHLIIVGDNEVIAHTFENVFCIIKKDDLV